MGENGQALILSEKENEELRAENLKLREENTRLKSNAKITHRMKFKPRRALGSVQRCAKQSKRELAG